nr:MAG TPA: hypothetical protein [Caudoviricetes sp.]
MFFSRFLVGALKGSVLPLPQYILFHFLRVGGGGIINHLLNIWKYGKYLLYLQIIKTKNKYGSRKVHK